MAKALDVERAKGCFGQSKYQQIYNGTRISIVRKYKKSRSGAISRGNRTLCKTRDAQITMLYRSMGNTNSRVANTVGMKHGSHRTLSGTRGHR